RPLSHHVGDRHFLRLSEKTLLQDVRRQLIRLGIVLLTMILWIVLELDDANVDRSTVDLVWRQVRLLGQATCFFWQTLLPFADEFVLATQTIRILVTNALSH